MYIPSFLNSTANNLFSSDTGSIDFWKYNEI